MIELKIFCILILSVTSVLGNKCYTCEGRDCLDEGFNPSNKCAEDKDTCTTIFKRSNDDDTEKYDLIMKGCSSDLTAECKNPENECFQCKSNDCNIALNFEDYIECIDCNSKQNTNCLEGKDRNKKKCNKECMAQFVLDEKKNFYNIIRTCADDIEKSQRDECIANKNCKICDGENCNKDLLSDQILKCQHCDDIEKCKTPDLKRCASGYDENEQCYAIYSKTNIKELGCLSKINLSQIEIDKLKEDHEIVLCKENNCNNIDKLPKRQECTLCNSKTSKDCAINPEKILAKTYCEIVDELACYTKILDDKSTERGCWKNLPETEKPNCNGEDKNGICSGCNSNLCNKEIFPANRQSCHVCASENNESCDTNDPNKAEICLFYDKNDQCISKLENKITYRGCTSILGDTCNEKDRTCRKCKENNCNIIDFQKIITDNNHGLWQDLPLTCLTCFGDDCLKKKINNVKCNRNEDCMTVFDKNGVVQMRGCENDVFDKKVEFCQLNPNLCFKCKSNNCNIATDLTDFVSCKYCGWPNGPSCNEADENKLTPTRDCYKSCMTALYQTKQSEDEPVYSLIRTCTDDKLPEAVKNCSTSIDDDSLCLTCTGENCNKELYPKDQTNCYMCDTVDNCEKPNSNKCPLYRKNDDCYNIYNNDQVITESGCKSSLRQDVIDQLQINNKIDLCNGKECNSIENRSKDGKCLLCDSKTDIECTTNPDQLKSTTICKAPNSQCYIRVNKDGFIERGCLASLKEDMYNCNLENSCTFCGDDNCNTKIYPEGRRTCQVCDSNKDPSCHNKPNSTQICPQYIPDEKCITTYKNKTTERGCGQLLKCDDVNNEKTCEICDTNNCNSVNLKRKNGSGNIIGNFIIISLLSIGLIIFFK